MSDQKVFVAVPCYDKKVFAPCVQSLMNAMQVLLLTETKFQFKFEVGCPYVSMARNNLVRAFMASDCTDLVFIDADIGFSAESFKALIDSPEQVVGGAYPKKQAVEEFAVRLKTDENNRVIHENGAILAEGLATGFLKIHRSVFEQMQAAHPELSYLDGATGQETFDLFGTFVKDGRWYGDDFGFCHLWEELGGKLYLLPDITFQHMGSKTFEGNFHSFLTRQSRVFVDMPPAVTKALAIDGFMDVNELAWLYEMACKMGSVAEVGSWKGRSTTVLLEGCKGPVLAVDNWSGHDPSSNGALERHASETDVHAEFLKNTSGYSNLTVRQSDSVAGSVEGEAFDMVFIDAEHTYEGCRADIDAWLPRARRVIAGHDYNEAWPGVIKAVKETFGQVKTVGSIWYVELS